VETSVALLLELGVVLFLFTLLGAGARKVGLSPIPLYLVGGLALGEGGLAQVPASGEFINASASIGVVLLLLTLGLEFSLGEFASSMRARAVWVCRPSTERRTGCARKVAHRLRHGRRVGTGGRDLCFLIGNDRTPAQ
jgi:hypothetical protein